MQPEPPVPVQKSQRRGVIEAIARIQPDLRSVAERFDAPAQEQVHAARRIVEYFIECQPARPDDIDDAPRTAHRASLTAIAHAGLRQVIRRRPAPECERQ